MKGYKGMDKDMKCRGMQFEVGKNCHVDGKIRLCENGLHFCKKLSDVFDYYRNNGTNRFFEIEASGDIVLGNDKCVTSDLRIIRELDLIEVNRCYYGDGYGNGNGNDNGNGYGDGYGNGDGDGNGNGYGNGDGNGNGYGDGDGNGNGNGYGDGYGNGNGYGNIQKILRFKEETK